MSAALLVSWFFYSCVSSDPKLDGFDFRLFNNTPLEELAQAVKKEDTTKIRELIRSGNIEIDYQEPKFGSTLLMMAVLNDKYNSCQALLKYGASPNIHDNYNGTSPIIYAADFEADYSDNAKYLKLMLRYNANVNDIEIGNRQEGNTTRLTPLLAACNDVNQRVSPLQKVMLLVNAGADINRTNEFNNFALREALLHEHYDVVYYLLSKGAKYDMMLFDRGEFSKGGKKIFIADYLRELTPEPNSQAYNDKIRIVVFLRDKGIDYYSIPIPKEVEMKVKRLYPDTWKEYLKKY